ncbi:MAG: hypothetical protein HN754_10575 [Opitutae bacterium]|nr:hypothetical protein [Opitutae bacterium]
MMINKYLLKLVFACLTTIDLLPTFATLSGPKPRDERAIDGVNQLNFIFGKSKSARISFTCNQVSASLHTWVLQ